MLSMPLKGCVYHEYDKFLSDANLSAKNMALV
jgi:hypothetical protein